MTEGIRQVSGEDVEIVGASRTDSGAHAKGQVCHFDTEWTVPVERVTRIVNKRLPEDVCVVSAEVVDPEFHSRFWALSRTYQYRLATGARDPRRARYVHWTGRALDAGKMHEAAQKFVGSHDFLAFSHMLEDGQPTRRTIYRIGVEQVRDEVRLTVEGSSFVRGMMRRIAGSLNEIGRGRKDEDWIEELLQAENKDGLKWPPHLPASGLTLMKVSYGRHPSERKFRSDRQAPEGREDGKTDE